MYRAKRFLCLVLMAAPILWGSCRAYAQELNAKVTINHSQVQGTDASVFEEIQQNLTQFINERQWTSLQFQKNERIACNFNITVTKYDNTNNVFTCKAVIQANRPVWRGESELSQSEGSEVVVGTVVVAVLCGSCLEDSLLLSR